MDETYIRCLEEHFASSPDRLRPLMVSLNGHNSWLLSFPRPWADQKRSGRAYFHLVCDPWLVGPTELLGSWFIHIDLPAAPAMPLAEAVEAAARQIDDLASELVLRRRMSNEVFNPAGHIDAIVLGFHYYDHVHEATLRDFSGNVPVVATRQAAAMLKPWKHFRNVAIMSDLPPPMMAASTTTTTTTWRSEELHPGPVLPDWLTVLRLPGHRDINFCTTIVWTHAVAAVDATTTTTTTTTAGAHAHADAMASNNNDDVVVHEAIFNSPNGTLTDQDGPLQAFLDAEPKTRRLAMLHGLKESRVGGKQTSFGAKGGLQLYRKLGHVDYWVLSNHLELNYTGTFMRLSRAADTARTLEWALDQEEEGVGLSEKPARRRPAVCEVPNGGCLVLDV